MSQHGDARETVKFWLPVAAILFSVVSFALSFSQTLESARSRIRPVLVFVWEKDGWYVHNIGSGTALGIVIGLSNNTEDWTNPVRIPPLSVGGKMYLHWLGQCNVRALGAVYQDYENNKYTTNMWDEKEDLSLGHSLRWSAQQRIEPLWRFSVGELCRVYNERP